MFVIPCDAVKYAVEAIFFAGAMHLMRTMLEGKIHRATVTGADVDYEGSIAIDSDLLDAAGMIPNEQTHVFNVDNGERVVTYIIEAERGSGQIVVNGAAAHLFQIGQKIIICTFRLMDDDAARTHVPKVVLVDAGNRLARRPQ